MTAWLLALADWLLDRVMPPVRVHPEYLAASDRARLEVARERRRDAIRSLGDEDIARVLRGMAREFTVPRPRGGDA